MSAHVLRAQLSAIGTGKSRESRAQHIAALAERSLLLELDTWPKPGLVSEVDTGSHSDMDACLLRRSAAAIRPYFGELVLAGGLNPDMALLRKIGLRAEAAMLDATDGVNTHRGAIFGLGLLCAAVGLRRAGHASASHSLGRVVAARWGAAIRVGPRPSCSHGQRVARQYGAGGAREEAALGFPSVYEVGVPALNAARAPTSGAARVQACFALIAVLEDTNLLHRGGPEGLHFARQAARQFLARGGIRQSNWLVAAEGVHQAFVARRLSPGGTADVLAMSVFVNALEPSQGRRAR